MVEELSLDDRAVETSDADVIEGVGSGSGSRTS